MKILNLIINVSRKHICLIYLFIVYIQVAFLVFVTYVSKETLTSQRQHHHQPRQQQQQQNQQHKDASIKLEFQNRKVSQINL